jgi:hypothetical protein
MNQNVVMLVPNISVTNAKKIITHTLAEGAVVSLDDYTAERMIRDGVARAATPDDGPPILAGRAV